MKRAEKSKNNKIIIACLAVLIVIAVVVIVILMMNNSSSGNKENVDDEMTLVDTLGAGSDYEAKVYITKAQELVLDVKNSKHLNLDLNAENVPIYDKYLETNTENNSTVEYVSFYLNNTDIEYEDKPEIQYPAEYELAFISSVANLQYTIKIKVDAEIEYISGTMTEGEINNSVVHGYEEFTEKFGEITLPEKAIITYMAIGEEIYGDETAAVEQGRCEYFFEGSTRQILVTKASNHDFVYNGLSGVTPRKITVNDVAVDLFTDVGNYVAVYTIGDNMYINLGFSKADDSIKDDELISKLKPFIK